MTDRDAACRALAEALPECAYDERGLWLPRTAPESYGRFLVNIPAPDAPLHEQLAFVGRLAEAVGAFPTITCGNVGKRDSEGYRIQYEATVAFDMPQFEMPGSDRPPFAQASAPDLVLAAIQAATQAKRSSS